MATPRAAQHYDLEQRLRNMEQGLRALSGTVLRQRQLSVSEGDFTVSGDGAVALVGTGRLVQRTESDQLLYQLGDLPGRTEDSPEDYGTYLFLSKDGTAEQTNFHVYSVLPGPTHPDGYARLQFDGTDVSLSTTEQLLLGGPEGTYSQGYDGPGHRFTGDVYTDGSLHTTGITTTSNTANVRVAPGGRLLQVGSSLRFKQDVADAAVSPARVLELQGRTWRDRSEVADDPDTTIRHVGFIAEEVHAAGLGQFVEYDPAGDPLAIKYDRVSVALLDLAKDQQRQLGVQAERLDELERRLDELAA